MKLCRYNQNRVGVIAGELVYDATEVLDRLPPIRWPINHGDQFVRHFDKLQAALSAIAGRSGGIPLSTVSLLSPIANPSKIIAAPVNYLKHQAEARADVAINFGTDIKTIDQYGLFLKSNTSLVGPAEGVRLPEGNLRIDHEVEIVVVIGQECEYVSEASALDVIFGYCLGLDMSARGTEDRSWRKSYDSFTVLGPYLVTADEIADPYNLQMSLTVNGKTRQKATTRDLIFNIPRLISYASKAYRLYPGDVIMTGTPEGVGAVNVGDEMAAAADGLGEMVVRVHRRANSENVA